MATQASKNTLRNKMKHLRAQLSLASKTQSSQQIEAQILSQPFYKQAKHIALYYAVHNEVELASLWKRALFDKKSCYFPAIQPDKTLKFLLTTQNTVFQNNQYKIPEPQMSEDAVFPVEQLDLLILPVVAFDKHGTRLGMGAGYYDRTLEQSSHRLLLGVAYEFQRVDYIEPSPWDVPLDAVITEKTIYWR